MFVQKQALSWVYGYDWIDYKVVAFSIELLEWGRTISGFGGKKIQVIRDFKPWVFLLH